MLNDERDVCYPRYTYFVMSHTSTGLIFTLSFLGSGFGLRLSNGGGSMLGYLPERKKTNELQQRVPSPPRLKQHPTLLTFPSTLPPHVTSSSASPHAPFYSPTPWTYLVTRSFILLFKLIASVDFSFSSGV